MLEDHTCATEPLSVLPRWESIGVPSSGHLPTSRKVSYRGPWLRVRLTQLGSHKVTKEKQEIGNRGGIAEDADKSRKEVIYFDYNNAVRDYVFNMKHET